MRRFAVWGLLGIEAAVCVWLRFAEVSFAGVLTSAFAFPFEPIGRGLRALSLSGGWGNAAALILFAAIGLLPVLWLFAARKRRALCPEDALLPLLSALLFVALYLMTNPGLISGGAVGRAVLGGTVYSVLCGYLVLRVLRLSARGGAEQLMRYLMVFLSLLGALFVYAIGWVCVGGLVDSITALRAGNVGNEHLLGASYAFLVLRFAVDALPYALNVVIIRAALSLLAALRADRHSAVSVACAARVSRLCATALAVTTLAGIGFHVLQLAALNQIQVVTGTVELPLLPIAFTLAALLLARLVAENKQLKDDNDLFV